MKPEDLAAITVYSDLMTVLKERGYSEAEATETFASLSAQAEMEVTEELISKMSDEQLASLDQMATTATGEEIAEKLGLDGEEIDAIRAEKVAKLLSELAPVVDAQDDQVVTS